MNATTIEWTDATWNPVTGCTAVSDGCRHCYAASLAATRLAHLHRYSGLARRERGRGAWTGKVTLHEDALTQPLRWRRRTSRKNPGAPWMAFACDMSDLFHANVPFDFIDRVFAAFALTPWVHWQVLTKRPERMEEYAARGDIMDAVVRLGGLEAEGTMPLRNVWLGTSVENQQTADTRIPHLLRCPAAVSFVSLEPLLQAVDLSAWLWCSFPEAASGHTYRDGYAPRDALQWVIVGGESGPDARPCDVKWIRSIVGQCRAAGVACFVKQLGANSVDSQSQPGSEYRFSLRDHRGGDPSKWPADLRVRQWPACAGRRNLADHDNGGLQQE